MGDPDDSARGAGAPAARGGLSASAWAALAALGAAVITGGVTLLTHFLPAGSTGAPAAEAPERISQGTVSAVASATGTGMPTGTAPRSALLDQLTGRWTGQVTAGLQTFTMTLDVTGSCAQGKPCGTMTTNLLPCVGDITLVRINDGPQFDFATVRYSADSSTSCPLRPRGGDYFTLGADVLAYRAGYDGSVGGTLHRAK